MKKVAVFVVAFAAFIGQRVLYLRKLSLATRELPLNHLPNCLFLKNIENGAEDITILQDGLAILSTGLKFPGLPYFSNDPGKIYALDLWNPRLSPVELQIKGKLDLNSFNPHGISVYIDDDSDKSVYLFVVNHPKTESQVEIFLFVEADYALVHLKTVKHELLNSVNDVVAIGVESFYATNDRYFRNEALHTLSIILGSPWCSAVFYSPEDVRVVGDTFHSANGINMSPDKRYVYVSDILAHKIAVYEREKGNDLVHIKSVAVGSLCDNIELDHDTGDLWLGCHPNGAKFFSNDPKDPPGSEVIRIQNIHSELPVVTQVYADNGSVIIGSTVAAPYQGKLLIGTVYHKALCCDLK
ncbi:serum paraoxonase/arylesterase 2-like isoform 3-T3 [Aplochiton taeniatus]